MQNRLADSRTELMLTRWMARVEAPAATLPAGMRVPFGWPAFAVQGDTATRLRFDAPAPASVAGGAVRLRVSVGLDVRSAAMIAVSIGDDTEPIGQLDARFASVCQICELALPQDQLERVMAEGLLLRRTDSSEAAWLFGPGAGESSFSPHLLAVRADVDPMEAFHARLNSLASVTQYGWMEGCVLDALDDLGYHATLAEHLDLYFRDGGLVYEDFRSHPMDGVVEGSETTNMFGPLARRRPTHPAIDLCLAMFDRRTQRDGTILDGQTVAEHCYTVAYPLAVVGRMRGDARRRKQAVEQLTLRAQRLRTDDAIWLRCDREGRRSYRNWSRGCAWYVLGMARTLVELDAKDRPDALVEDLADALRLLASHQSQEGLWRSFVDEPDTLPETSGSAGIAAAMAIAVKHGWVDPSLRTTAERTVSGLARYLTPDGMLGGMSQSNKAEAGEDVQRSAHRIIGQCAMGLMGQLLAALR